MSGFRRRNLEASGEEKYGRSFSETLERWAEIQRRTEDELASIPDEALSGIEGRHPLTGFQGPFWQFLLFYLEHEAHHRGQLSAYLKVIGSEQPAAAFGR